MLVALLALLGLPATTAVYDSGSGAGGFIEEHAVHVSSIPYRQNVTLVAHSYIDYILTIDANTALKNVEFEVFDQSEHTNPKSLALYLHEGSVPEDARDTPRRVEAYTDRPHRLFAMILNVLEVKEAVYHVRLQVEHSTPPARR